MIRSQKRKEDPRKKDSQIVDSNKHEIEIFFIENHCSWVPELMIRIHRLRFCKGAIAPGLFVYTHNENIDFKKCSKDLFRYKLMEEKLDQIQFSIV